MTIKRGDGEDGTRELSAEQLALWDSLVERVRANPTEPSLAAVLELADGVPRPWRDGVRADCYKARVAGESLTEAARCLYAALRQWGKPSPSDHEAALIAAQAVWGTVPAAGR
jgi:hypothetical protein